MLPGEERQLVQSLAGIHRALERSNMLSELAVLHNLRELGLAGGTALDATATARIAALEKKLWGSDGYTGRGGDHL